MSHVPAATAVSSKHTLQIKLNPDAAATVDELALILDRLDAEQGLKTEFKPEHLVYFLTQLVKRQEQEGAKNLSVTISGLSHLGKMSANYRFLSLQKIMLLHLRPKVIINLGEETPIDLLVKVAGDFQLPDELVEKADISEEIEQEPRVQAKSLTNAESRTVNSWFHPNEIDARHIAVSQVYNHLNTNYENIARTVNKKGLTTAEGADFKGITIKRMLEKVEKILPRFQTNDEHMHRLQRYKRARNEERVYLGPDRDSRWQDSQLMPIDVPVTRKNLIVKDPELVQGSDDNYQRFLKLEFPYGLEQPVILYIQDNKSVDLHSKVIEASDLTLTGEVRIDLKRDARLLPGRYFWTILDARESLYDLSDEKKEHFKVKNREWQTMNVGTFLYGHDAFMDDTIKMVRDRENGKISLESDKKEHERIV